MSNNIQNGKNLKGFAKIFKGKSEEVVVTEVPVKEQPTHRRAESQYKREHPRSYERHRGRNGNKAMSYYLPDDILKLLNIKAAQDGKTKSELVLEGLHYVLREEIREAQAKKREVAV